ncbi:MAG: protoglobin domain-containing protein [Bradyrhizobium sp.]|uniref:protoglobin domain-containing protein n=1 Tax=Bradyrhizobium sp. TaxID=376 RepID=UPI002731FF2E|nr:protoglobin domain-containing protein [Bradyrhizobium sp.]MDP1866487.1 protoglobin domain-containing protein [Bradyrhizobium sp.]
MTPDWNAIRLDLLDIDAPMRATLREMRPFFAKALPGILARFYDKVRQHDPSSGIFQNGAMQEAIRLQLQHWDLIGAAEFSLPYFSSVARLSEFHQRAGVAPQWYVGCRLMFIADQLMKAVETEVELPRDERAARDKRTLMQNAIAKVVMLDTENVVAVYFGSNRQSRKNAIADGKISEIASAISSAI